MIQTLLQSSRFRVAVRVAAALLFVLVLANLGLAQDDAAAAPAAAEAEELSIANLIAKSGIIGWVIILLSVVMLALVIENYVTLNREKLAPPELIDEIQSLFDEGQYQEAMELCENEPNLFTRVCAAGIAKIGHPFEVIQTSLAEMGDEEAVKLHQKMGSSAGAAASGGFAPEKDIGE
jgi:biopolymer transport protein ExbB/TolQ